MLVVASALVIGIIAVLISYNYGKNIGIKHGRNEPTKAAQAELAATQQKCEAAHGTLDKLNSEIDAARALILAMSPLKARMDVIAKQRAAIEGIEQEIARLRTRRAHTLTESDKLHREIIQYPATARNNNSQGLLNHLAGVLMDIDTAVVDKQMDLAKAEKKLLELIDGLAAKQQELANAG